LPIVDIFCYFMSCHGRHLEFDRTNENSVIRSADPETPTLEPNEVDRLIRCGDVAVVADFK